MMRKKEKISGVIYNENKGWKAQLLLSNNDKYYTVYFGGLVHLALQARNWSHDIGHTSRPT